jgi:LPS export ABC transporter protein LptC
MACTPRFKIFLLCCVFMVEIGCDVQDNSNDVGDQQAEQTEVNTGDELDESLSIQVIIDGSFQYSEKGEVRNILEAGKLERFENNDIWQVDDGFTLYIEGDKSTNRAQLSGGRGTYDSKIGHLIARDGVLLVNSEGDKLKTEYLVWSHDSDKVHTNRSVSVETATGVLFGKGLEADGSFENYKILEPTGSFDLP